jgi:hypothetical protein
MGAFFAASRKKPGFPLQFLDPPHGGSAGFPLLSLAQPSGSGNPEGCDQPLARSSGKQSFAPHRLLALRATLFYIVWINADTPSQSLLPFYDFVVFYMNLLP